jgi:hypothetical protein
MVSDMYRDVPNNSRAQVCFGGAWYEARVLSWSLEEDRWWANVRWWPPSGASLLGAFPETDVRDAAPST